MKSWIQWPADLNERGKFVTFWILAVSTVFAAIAIWLKGETPSLGDWGDYLGGVFAAVAIVWAIVVHAHSQKKIEEDQSVIIGQNSATQDLLGSLSRIAAGQQVGAADVLANAKPVFAHTGSTGTPINSYVAPAQPIHGHMEFRNIGQGFSLESVTSNLEGANVSLSKTGQIYPDERFRVIIDAKTQLRRLEPISQAG